MNHLYLSLLLFSFLAVTTSIQSSLASSKTNRTHLKAVCFKSMSDLFSESDFKKLVSRESLEDYFIRGAKLSKDGFGSFSNWSSEEQLKFILDTFNWQRYTGMREFDFFFYKEAQNKPGVENNHELQSWYLDLYAKYDFSLTGTYHKLQSFNAVKVSELWESVNYEDITPEQMSGFIRDLMKAQPSFNTVSKISAADLYNFEFEVKKRKQWLDGFLNRYFGYNFKIAEKQLSSVYQTESFMGDAQWSEGNVDYGWLSTYEDIFTMLKHAEFDNNKTIVDIGSATGKVGFLTGLLYPNAKFIGYELVKERVKLSKQIAKSLKMKNLDFKQQDVSLPEFKIDVADVYYLYDSVNIQTFIQVISKIEKIQKNHPERDISIYLRRGSGRILKAARKDDRLEEVYTLSKGITDETIGVFKFK